MASYGTSVMCVCVRATPATPPQCPTHSRLQKKLRVICRDTAKRWSAVSDGGEDQGAEEASRGVCQERSFITSVLEKEPSRASD